MEILDVFEKAKVDQSLVSLREIHRSLKVRSRFRDWVKRRIRCYEYHRDVDFVIISSLSLTANAGRPCIDYFVKADTASEIAMQEPWSQSAKEYRDYLIDMEEQLRSSPPPTKAEQFYNQAKAMADEERRRGAQQSC